MTSFLGLLAARTTRYFAEKTPLARWLWLLPFLPVLLIVGIVSLVLLIAVVIVSQASAGGCGNSVPISAPGNVKNRMQEVRYFESQGITAIGAAGIEGNTFQESGDDPLTSGGGLAQWLGSRWVDMVAWSTSQGYPGDSSDPRIAMAGQVMYVVYDLRTKYANVLAVLNSATDTDAAVLAFESGYEECSGTSGFMVPVPPGALCNDLARKRNAAQILAQVGGPGTPGVTPVGACIGLGGTGGDPIPRFRPGRDDKGVDGCAKPGDPIFAPYDSVLVDYQANWFEGQPLLLFRFTPSLTGTYLNDQYWYVAEQISPVSTTKGTSFAAGQPVATFASSGTCIEIGWGNPGGGDTLAEAIGRNADKNPPRGALTPEAEAFKIFFHIPWVGVSP